MKTTTYGTTIAALLLAGCTGMELGDELDSSLDELDEVELDAGATPGELGLDGPGSEALPVIGRPVDEPQVLCHGAPIVGMLDDASYDCSLVGLPGNWSAERMFSEGTADLLGLSTLLPATLGRYCVYTRATPPTITSDYYPLFDAIDASGAMNLATTAADCLGELPQSTLYHPSVGQGIHDAFAANADILSGPEIAPTEAHRSPVELMIIDTASHVAAVAPLVNPDNFHGLQLSSLVRDIVCPTGLPACLPNIRHVVGMPRDGWNTPPDYLHGGQYGTQGDIARAIYAKVTDWRERIAADPLNTPRRLVLNLSLGWDRDAGATLDPTRGPNAGLMHALEYASCMGVITVAAAGNNSDPDCPDDRVGPTLPGGYEGLPAPSAAECVGLGFGGGESQEFPIFGGPVGYRPLVYAVGGVDGHDQPLVNSRELGQPRLVGYATYGTAGSGPSGEALTGTSISSAVAASSAAMVWTYRPELRPSEVMELLYQSGYATGATADFVGPGALSSAVHRVSVCAALDLACVGEPASTCPQLGCVAAAPGPLGYQDDFFTATTNVLDDVSTTVEDYDSGLLGAAPDCSTPPDLSILAKPQPEIPVCSHCSIDIPPEDATSSTGDDTLIINIDSSYDSLVDGVKLTVYDGTRTILTYDLDSYAAGLDSTTVTTIGVHAPNTIKAYLEFTLDDGSGGSVTQSNAVTVNFTGATILP